jgi:hypothetical protein
MAGFPNYLFAEREHSMARKIVCLLLAIAASPHVAHCQSPAGGTEYVTRAELKEELGKISQQIAALGGTPQRSLEQRMAAIEANQNNIRDVQQEQGVILGQIAMRGESGEYHWRFDTNSQSARDEFNQAIRNSTPRSGSLVIENRTWYTQKIKVNGWQFEVMPKAKIGLYVPIGQVTTELQYEPEKTWQIAMPDYYQRIIIR